MDRDLGDGMNIVGNIGQFFGARLAEFLTLGVIIVFSWRKGKTFPLRIGFFFLLAVLFTLVAAVPALSYSWSPTVI